MKDVSHREFLGVRFDIIDQQQALAKIFKRDVEESFDYIVTPNVDHVVRLNGGAREQLEETYRSAWLALCDSRILEVLARFVGLRLPLVTGSDLTRSILDFATNPGDEIGVIGLSDEESSELQRMFPQLKFHHHSPPFGFELHSDKILNVVDFVEKHDCRYFFFCIGSPKSENLVNIIRERGRSTGLGLCTGASLLFILGRVRRAPVLMQKLGLEWFFRFLCEPRRLFRRYFLDDVRIFVIYMRWVINNDRFKY